mmetsp:Transcript_23012/g.72138  ORF Transcript_23012/g.72138 Transcript_23012/m.72138 type:complete len:201 (+) Transcript_23012:759-1361(+)
MLARLLNRLAPKSPSAKPARSSGPRSSELPVDLRAPPAPVACRICISASSSAVSLRRRKTARAASAARAFVASLEWLSGMRRRANAVAPGLPSPSAAAASRSDSRIEPAEMAMVCGDCSGRGQSCSGREASAYRSGYSITDSRGTSNSPSMSDETVSSSITSTCRSCDALSTRSSNSWPHSGDSVLVRVKVRAASSLPLR